MPPSGIAAGVLSALSFGAGDFAGAVRRAPRRSARRGCRRARDRLVALLIGLIVLRPPFPDVEAMLLGLAAGVAGAVGLAALYRGMSLGVMGIVASLSGAGSLAIPLVVGALLGATIAPLQLLGVACAALAAAAASGASRDEIGRRALLLAGAAALGFGAWYVLLDLAARGGDPLWALVFSRATSAGPCGGRRLRPHSSAVAFPFRIVVAAGLLDVGGNALYVVARDLDPDRPRGRAHRAVSDRHHDPGRASCSASTCRASARSASRLALLGIVLISAGG